MTYLSDTVEILERLEDIDRFELLLMGELGLLEELPTDFLLRNMEEKAEVMEFFVARLASLPKKIIQNYILQLGTSMITVVAFHIELGGIQEIFMSQSCQKWSI